MSFHVAHRNVVISPGSLMKTLIDYLGITTVGTVTGLAVWQSALWEHPLVISALAGLLGSILTGLLKATVDWHKSGLAQSVKMAELAQNERKMLVEQHNLDLDRLQKNYQVQMELERANRHEVVNQLHAVKMLIYAMKQGVTIDQIEETQSNLIVYDVEKERQAITQGSPDNDTGI